MRHAVLALLALPGLTPAVLPAILPATALAQQTEIALSPEAINAADLMSLVASATAESDPEGTAAAAGPDAPSPAVIRLQVLLDRAGASPGVIDGFDGDNVAKAIRAFETMQGLPVDGVLDAELIAALETNADPVVGTYEVSPDDVAEIGDPVPDDYAEKAQRDFLGYASVAEELAERFHLDIDLLAALNPGASYAPGEQLIVTAYGPDTSGSVARIEADKAMAQLRAYDAEGRLLVAYPATIGSDDNPSPFGVHTVEAVAPMPNYTYDPSVNFQQGDNDEKLVIPPGPNGPVGSMWIDLSEPTYGIHGTPEPSEIDKTASHGCIRLTNWDATELAAMVAPGVEVSFLD